MWATRTEAALESKESWSCVVTDILGDGSITLEKNAFCSKNRGEVIHSDVCGPMTVNSPGGSRYFVTFTDEYSGYVTVACISKNSDVQLEFKRYHYCVERRYDCVVKVLHCDGGGEYQALKNHLQCQGIECVMLPPYSAEQNGMAERTNRTLVECARSMLLHAKLPFQFWAEAIAFATDVRNRFLCPRNRNKTSFEMMTGNLPRGNYIRVFGSVTWIHAPKEKHKKLDAKSELGVLVAGFENSVYNVWLPTRCTAVLTRHAKVLENTFLSTTELQIDEGTDGLILRQDDTFSNGNVQTYANRNPSKNGPARESEQYSPSYPTEQSNVDIREQKLDSSTGTEPLTYFPPKPDSDVTEENILTDVTLPTNEGTDPAIFRDPADELVSSRYPSRNRNQTDYYRPGNAHLVSSRNCLDPASIEESMELPDSSLWKEALESELKSLREHGTWVAGKLPEGAKTLPSRFVCRIKLLQDGSVCSYKARLVVKGYMQGNVDFTYAPVVAFTTVRAALAIAVKRNYVVHQMDVRTAFCRLK